MVTAAIKLKNAPWKESCDKPRQCIKKQRHHFANKGHIVRVMVFPTTTYGCESFESWIIKNLSAEELMLSNCGVG